MKLYSWVILIIQNLGGWFFVAKGKVPEALICFSAAAIIFQNLLKVDKE